MRKLLEIKDQLEDELRRHENATPDQKTKKELAKLKVWVCVFIYTISL